VQYLTSVICLVQPSLRKCRTHHAVENLSKATLIGHQAMKARAAPRHEDTCAIRWPAETKEPELRKDEESCGR
jgi:hypothetical protein